MTSPKTLDRSVILDRLLNKMTVRPHGWAACRVAATASLSVAPYDTATLNYVVAGKGSLRVASRDFGPVGPRNIIILPPATAHTWGSGEQVETLSHGGDSAIDRDLASLLASPRLSGELVVVTGRVSATLGTGLGLFEHLREPVVDQLAEVESARFAFERLISELATPVLGSQALVQAYLHQILILLFRRQLATGSPAVHRGLLDEHLSRALVAVVEHPERLHTIANLSRTAGMSQSSFVKRFRAAFGQSPPDYIHTLRMHAAAHLLTTTDLHIKTIASEVGFSSRSYFSRSFRATFGADPTAFRRSGSDKSGKRYAANPSPSSGRA